SLAEALDDARCFVLMASEAAAASEWVEQELEHWLARDGVEPPLLALTDGELEWGDGDFDWTRTTAVPKALRGRYADEPLWVDFRALRGAKRLSLRNRAFLEGVATLAPAAVGADKETLLDEDRRQRRRGLAVGAVGGALLLAAAAAALYFSTKASGEQSKKHEQELIDESRQLAAASQRQLGARLDRALLLAVQAEQTHDTPQARSALLAALEQAPQLAAFLPGGE